MYSDLPRSGVQGLYVGDEHLGVMSPKEPKLDFGLYSIAKIGFSAERSAPAESEQRFGQPVTWYDRSHRLSRLLYYLDADSETSLIGCNVWDFDILAIKWEADWCSTATI